MNIKKKKCLICNQIFQPNGCNQKWCKNCRYVKKNCFFCNNKFIILRSKINQSKDKFCSHSCEQSYFYKMKKNILPFTGKHTKITKEKMSNTQKKRYKNPQNRLKMKISAKHRWQKQRTPNNIIVKALQQYLKEKPLKIISKKPEKINLRIRFKILKRDNFTCQYCGKKAPKTKLHIDHIIPKSKNGKNKENNLITACMDCNLGKSNIY